MKRADILAYIQIAGNRYALEQPLAQLVPLALPLRLALQSWPSHLNQVARLTLLKSRLAMVPAAEPEPLEEE